MGKTSLPKTEPRLWHASYLCQAGADFNPGSQRFLYRAFISNLQQPVAHFCILWSSQGDGTVNKIQLTILFIFFQIRYKAGVGKCPLRAPLNDAHLFSAFITILRVDHGCSGRVSDLYLWRTSLAYPRRGSKYLTARQPLQTNKTPPLYLSFQYRFTCFLKRLQVDFSDDCFQFFHWKLVCQPLPGADPAFIGLVDRINSQQIYAAQQERQHISWQVDTPCIADSRHRSTIAYLAQNTGQHLATNIINTGSPALTLQRL